MIASSIQHHPEPWPRTAHDGLFTSWNRSLAYVLSNNGFDVWLAETRGSDDDNTRHVKTKALKNTLEGGNVEKNMTVGESVAEVFKQWDYWAFTQDDIIAHEVKAQIDLVLKETGSKKLSLFTYSLSTPISLGFLSTRPEYGEKIHGFVSMAPIISGQRTNDLVRTVFQGVCPYVPDTLGKLFFTDFLLSKPVRELLVTISKPKRLRYSFIKMFINILLGPSAQYETLLEINVLGHLLRRLSFRELKQLCQQMRSNKLQKFDYGIIKNKLIYGQVEPPVYDLSNLNLNTWIIVVAENDALSTLAVMDYLVEIVHPKPIAKIIAPGFNHGDLFAGVENDRYVNIPIMKYLQSISTIPGEKDGYNYGDKEQMVGSESTTTARQIDLRSIIPPELAESTRKISKSIQNITNINPDEIFANLHKSWQRLMANFDLKKLSEVTKFDEFSKYLPKITFDKRLSNEEKDYGGYII